MSNECTIYSNNPEPDRLVLYLTARGREVFRVEFFTADSAKEFEKKYDFVSAKIRETSAELWHALDQKRNFRKNLRACRWIETREAAVN